MRLALMTLLGMAVATGASAHHSFAVFFDTEQQLTKVSGVVKDFRFSNPHGVITLAVPKEGGGTITWRAETNSPSVLRRHGWSPDGLHVGDRITIEGWRARDGTQYMRMRAVRMADGRPVGQPLG